MKAAVFGSSMALVAVAIACGTEDGSDGKRPTAAEATPTPSATPTPVPWAVDGFADCGIAYEEDEAPGALEAWAATLAGDWKSDRCMEGGGGKHVTWTTRFAFEKDAKGNSHLRQTLVEEPCGPSIAAGDAPTTEDVPGRADRNEVRMRLSKPIAKDGLSYRIVEWLTRGPDGFRCVVSSFAQGPAGADGAPTLVQGRYTVGGGGEGTKLEPRPLGWTPFSTALEAVGPMVRCERLAAPTPVASPVPSPTP